MRRWRDGGSAGLRHPQVASDNICEHLDSRKNFSNRVKMRSKLFSKLCVSHQ